MKTKIIKTIVLCFLVIGIVPAIAQKQKDILIYEDLSANSEALKIKLGTQVLGKMAKYKFGEYAVIEGKVGWTTTTGSSNIFNTKAESKTKNKFSFVLGDKASNLATVNAALNLEVKVTLEMELFAGFYVGDNETLLDKENFSATLFLNNDTSNLWLLFMNKAVGSQTENGGQALLTNGERKIFIISATSNIPGAKTSTFPARGYQFIEDDKTLSALQYLGAGAFGMNKCYAWLHNNTDPNTKLILSAAMIALLHKELDTMF